jgi:hypothetical protein
MDANNQVPSFEIPKNAEQDPISVHSPEVDRTRDLEGTREILPAPPMPSQATFPVQTTIQSDQSMMASSTQTVIQDDSHIIADDSDVIEKEWVERAKKIIAITAEDPHAEAREIHKLKATYIKKRFNKDVPLADEQVK